MLKTSDFLPFAHIISIDELQSAQFSTLSLGENKTDVYHAENINFSTKMKTSRKVHICLHWFLYPPDNVLLCEAMPVRYQLFNFHVMLLLVNVMFSSELCQWFSSFLRCFRDPIRVPRIENWVPRIRENYHRVSRIRENRVPTGPHRIPNIFLKKNLNLVKLDSKPCGF